METVAEFMDGNISSVMLVLFMLVLRRGRVFRAPTSYSEDLGAENSYPD
jgi:hypothetical protein